MTIQSGLLSDGDYSERGEMADLEQKVKEFAALAQSLPENLQVTCFELLLKHELGLGASVAIQPPSPPGDGAEDEQKDPPPAPSQDDLAESDLHAKARAFLKQQSLSIEHINNLFYKEGDQILTLFEDLKTAAMAEGQIRIALLQALTRALSTGDFEADVEAVRAEAKDRKFYDRPNFSSNFKNNAAYFDYDTFDKTVKTVRLSTDGKKKLAEIIKELQ